MKTQVVLSMLTALCSSLCCITPILVIIGGTGSMVSSFHWLEPFRPYFISASVLVLGFAWFQLLNTKKKEDCCEPRKISFFRSKGHLSIITIFSLLLITFPSYSGFFFNESAIHLLDQDKNKNIELKVSGITCTSCELEIESEVKKLHGILISSEISLPKP